MKKPNLHAHHRQRLRDRFNRYGYSSFELHNMLELLLFYGIPYKDTTPIAHELLEKCSSFADVLCAPVELLTQVSGVGKYAAEFLNFIDFASDFVVYRGMCMRDEQSMYHTTSSLGEMLIKRLGAVDESGVFVVMMNNRHELVRIVPTNCGTGSLHNINKNQLVRDIIESGASIAVLARYKSEGVAVPSNDDLIAAEDIKHSLGLSGIRLDEFLVVTKNDYSAVLNNECVTEAKENSFFENLMFAADDGLGALPVNTDSHSAVEASRFLRVSQSKLSDKDVLSRLLSYSMRSGCDEMAESLLRRFENLFGVVSTEMSELLDFGVSEVSATLLRLTLVLKKYRSEKLMLPQIKAKDADTLPFALSLMYLGDKNESIIVLCYDKNGELCDFQRLGSGGVNSVLMTLRGVSELSLAENVKYVVIAHNHPHGLPYPSKADIRATQSIMNTMQNSGKKLLSHFVISDGSYTELTKCQL